MNIEERIEALEREVFGEKDAPMTPEEEWADVGLEGEWQAGYVVDGHAWWSHALQCMVTRHHEDARGWSVRMLQHGAERHHVPTLRAALAAAREHAPVELRRHLYPRDEWRSFGDCEPEEGQRIETTPPFAVTGTWNDGVIVVGDTAWHWKALKWAEWRPAALPSEETAPVEEQLSEALPGWAIERDDNGDIGVVHSRYDISVWAPNPSEDREKWEVVHIGAAAEFDTCDDAVAYALFAEEERDDDVRRIRRRLEDAQNAHASADYWEKRTHAAERERRHAVARADKAVADLRARLAEVEAERDRAVDEERDRVVRLLRSRGHELPARVVELTKDWKEYREEA